MSTSGRGTSFLQELRDFTAFLKSVWGILTGISAVFPLSNVFTQILPLRTTYDDPIGPIHNFSPTLITTVAALVTFFVLLVTFGGRNRVKAKRDRRAVQHTASATFVLGLLSLFLYLGAYFALLPLFYLPLEIYRGDPRGLIGDFILLLSYTGFFALMTRSFLLLGLIEFYGDKSRA
ncbi:MAG: hypothetical protein HYU87_11370 [Chloroflexi bacterium]|nr:hypothetical protein [Chloroflexota bacterium]